MISIAHVLIALLGVVAGIIFGAIPGNDCYHGGSRIPADDLRI